MVCIVFDMNCLYYFRVVHVFLGFWKFSRNRQAAHIVFAIYGFLKRYRLVVNSQPPGDACWKAQFSRFWLSCPVLMNTRQVTRVTLVRFLCFLGSGEILIGGKKIKELVE